MPVIVGVAKENNIKPTRALAISVSASLLGIVASPISAAVIFFSATLEKNNHGWGYLELIAVSIPATLLALLVTSIFYLCWDRFKNRTYCMMALRWRRSGLVVKFRLTPAARC